MSGATVKTAGRGTIRWRCMGRTLECGPRPLIMGILNVTPDSFYDGNRHFDTNRAVARGLEMIAEGADIVDVGGESTRPGAEPVGEDEETRRVIPVIERLAGAAGPGAVISVDTSKAAVARRAVAAGACIINDVTALAGDPGMAAAALASGAGVVLMHMQGSPRVMQDNPRYGDVVAEVAQYLDKRVDGLAAAGMDRDRIALDPGIGFGKDLEHNLALLGRLDVLVARGRPVLVGLSRKSFLGRLTGREPDQRLIPGIAALSFCIAKGAHVLRVHDVKESADAAKVACALAAHG